VKWRVLAVLSLAELLGMALWFSASAVVGDLSIAWDLSSGEQAWLTMSVQAGFVLGTLVSAVTNLSDVVSARRLFAVSAAVGAITNASIPLFSTGIESTLALRFATGAALAGVYPPGMKIIASWFREGRGMAMGVLVGALTAGSAAPHLLKIIGTPDWRTVMGIASGCSVLASLICLLFVRDGPYLSSGARFDWRYVGKTLNHRGIRLANFGYLGHMWELYAVWTWIPAFLLGSFKQSDTPGPERLAALVAFGVIAVGSAGSVVAGILADRVGRTTVTIVALAVSGGCCLMAGTLFGSHPFLLILFCLVWGFAVVADSAQFSASVTELADPQYVGTVLTLQTCMGFLLTLGSIRLIPVVVETVSWDLAFALLAIGPAVGIGSMWRLKNSTFAARIGGERLGIEP
jgi:MFS family permease